MVLNGGKNKKDAKEVSGAKSNLVAVGSGLGDVTKTSKENLLVPIIGVVQDVKEVCPSDPNSISAGCL